ncbi:hypothetical protein [Streptomyces sp. NPDC001927]
MSELLASCAAAEAVSTPPRTPEHTQETDAAEPSREQGILGAEREAA